MYKSCKEYPLHANLKREMEVMVLIFYERNTDFLPSSILSEHNKMESNPGKDHEQNSIAFPLQ